MSGMPQTQQDKSRDNEVIHRHYDFLVDRMSLEFGVVDKLYSCRTLSILQKNEIESKSLSEKRNKILLKHIVQENASKKLFETLTICGQSHLVKYMEADGVYVPEFGGNWPLSEKESTILLDNYDNLIDILDSSDLVGLLYQTGVLNVRQKNLLSSKVTTEEKNKILLEVLRKGSLGDYWTTIRCLHASNQSHIARIFESGGVVVRIDANIQPKPLNQSEVENSLVTKITDLLPFIPEEKLEETYKNLVAVAAKHSISFYFLCSKPDDVDRLKQVTSGSQLKTFVEDLFNRLMIFPKRLRVILKWPRDLFSKARQNIAEIQVKNFIDEPVNTTIDRLPLELLDSILQRAYLCSRSQSHALYSNKDSAVIMFLTSVCALWLRRILRKRFKKSILTQLERIYRIEFAMYLSFSGCLHYLEEALFVEDTRLARKDLKAADFLTDLQITRLLRKQNMKDTRRRRSGMLASLTIEILTARKRFVEQNIYISFIRYLPQTKHTNEAKVLEEGGSTAKVKLRLPRNSCTEAWSREFSSKLNNLKDKKQSKSDNIKMIIQQWKDSDLEILESIEDREVIVWIWCKSQNAVENLKSLYRSQTLIDHLYRLANERNRNRSANDMDLDELNQMKIDTTSLRNLVINVEGRLDVENAEEDLIGVTKLRNKIFVISWSWSSFMYVINVFDDHLPFRLKRKMTFEEIKYATDLESFEKKFCLYVADVEVKCLWKICPPDEDKIVDGNFTCTALECPDLSRFNDIRMAITDRGQILIIGDRSPTLLFCESESALNCPIRLNLPETIKRPSQVTENSKGNFIFLHRTLSDDGEWAVSEVGRNGKTIIRQHVGTDQWLDPSGSVFLMVDPYDKIFLADTNRHMLILLDSRLQHMRSLRLDTYDENGENNLLFLFPRKMFYDERKSHLIIIGDEKTLVFSFSRFLISS